MAIKHNFACGIADNPADALKVQPGDWNETHTIDEDGIPDTAITIEKIGNPEVSTLHELLNHKGSAGILHAGAGAIADNGVDKFTIAAGTGRLRATAGTSADLISIAWDELEVLYSALTTETLYYVYIELIAGVPTVSYTTTFSDIVHVKDIDLGIVWYNGENLVVNNPASLYNLPDRQHEMLWEAFGYVRVFGAKISEPAGLKLALSASEWYLGLTEFEIDAIDTNVADTFTYFHQTNGAWTEVTGQTDIDVTQYNDITSGLVALNANKYAVHWVYLNANGGMYVVYGDTFYNLAAGAEAASIPTLPPQFARFCRLVGKVTIVKDGTSFYELGSPFTEDFTAGAANSHLNLTDIGTNTHAQIDTELLRTAGMETGADVTDAVNVGSSIFGADAKTTPVDADTFAINDTAASNVLKKLTWANIKATSKTYFDALYTPIAHNTAVAPHSGHTTYDSDGKNDTVGVGETIQEVLNSWEMSLGGSGVLTIPAGTYNEDIHIPKIFVDGDITLQSDGLISTVSTTLTGGTSGNTTTKATVVKTGAGWTVDAYKNKLCYFVDNANAGKYRIIVSNTTDTLVLIGDPITTPTNGDSFIIYSQSVHIDSIEVSTPTKINLIGSDITNYIHLSNANVTLNRCGVNSFSSAGNAKFVKHSQMYAENCVIYGVDAYRGGGDFRNTSNSEWVGCAFRGSSVANSWGGLFRIGYHLFRSGCLFDNYTWGIRVGSAGYGQTWGAVFIENCGTGIYVDSGSGLSKTTAPNYTGNTTDEYAEAASNSWIV